MNAIESKAIESKAIAKKGIASKSSLPGWLRLAPSRHLGLTLCLVLLAGCEQPDGQLLDASGAAQGFNFDQWRGQWVLINYWAEWCAPCRREIPELNELDQRSDVQVLGVNFDGLQGDKLAQVVSKMQVQFPTLLSDPGPRFAVTRPTVLPVTLLIGPDGELRKTLRGPQTQASILAAIGAGAQQVLQGAPEA